MALYNINELLEKKKTLEQQEAEFRGNINATDLTYREEKIIDHTASKNNRVIVARSKITLADYCQKYNGIVDELKRCKTAIQKYNAQKVLGLIQERDGVRKKIILLENLKRIIPRNKATGRKVTRQDKDGVALETIEVTEEPMFTREDIDKQFDTLAAQERKLNTEIQRENLNAKIEVK
jgi:hypothetical protein